MLLGGKMDIHRVRENEKEYIEYEESYLHNTALMAFEGEVSISIFEYRVVSPYKAEVINFTIFNEADEADLYKGFIKELCYWNPYIREVVYEGQELKIKNYAEIFKISIDKIVPAQLTVNEEKLEKVLSWIDKPQDVIISCLKINDKVICIDGHTRLVAAYKKDFHYVYGYYEEIENKDFYETCLKWCNDEGINSVENLLQTVVTSKEHEEIWIDRCQQYFKEKQ